MKREATPKRRLFLLAMAALLAVGGLWFARSVRRTQPAQPSPVEAGSGGADGSTGAGGMLQPPDPNRRFTDFTPEQRVQFARQGHGPGG
ncbi:MAG: hypothetical protein H7A46_04755 [Verrucomicrobiales bacterium]|nr:hypothetical protein [Verrucomicrobiales bacterium]